MKNIQVLTKIGKYFINEKDIRSIIRYGTGIKIILFNGKEIEANVPYEKARKLFPPS